MRRLPPPEPDGNTKRVNDLIVIACLCATSVLLLVAMLANVFWHTVAMWMNGLM